MTVKLGYCIHCGQGNITCINTAKDGKMTHYSITKQGECGPLMIFDVEIPEPYASALTEKAGGLRELLESARHALRSYENGNQTTGLARRVADRIDAALDRTPPQSDHNFEGSDGGPLPKRSREVGMPLLHGKALLDYKLPLFERGEDAVRETFVSGWLEATGRTFKDRQDAIDSAHRAFRKYAEGVNAPPPRSPAEPSSE